MRMRLQSIEGTTESTTSPGSSSVTQQTMPTAWNSRALDKPVYVFLYEYWKLGMPLHASAKKIPIFTSFFVSVSQFKMKCCYKKWQPNCSANTALTSRSNLSVDHPTLSTAAAKKNCPSSWIKLCVKNPTIEHRMSVTIHELELC